MARQRTQTAPEKDSFDGLEDGEKVIITDQRTIEKKTVAANPAQTQKVIDIEPENDTADEFEENETFSDSSIFSFIEQKDFSENLDAEFCSLQIRREPDGHGDNFLKPNKSRLNLPVMRNVSLLTDRFDIEEEIRELHGGGHYFIQIQYAGKFIKSWKTSLSDSPVAIQKSKFDTLQQSNAQQTQQTQQTAPPVNAFAEFFQALKMQKEMKDLMFGDELKELERLRAELADRQSQQPAPVENEKLALLKFAVDTKNEKFVEKAINTLFGEEASGGILDTAKFVFDNDEKLIKIGQGILGMFAGSKTPPTKAALEQMLGKKPAEQNPNETAPPTRSTFKAKRKPQTEKEN